MRLVRDQLDGGGAGSQGEAQSRRVIASLAAPHRKMPARSLGRDAARPYRTPCEIHGMKGSASRTAVCKTKAEAISSLRISNKLWVILSLRRTGNCHTANSEIPDQPPPPVAILPFDSLPAAVTCLPPLPHAQGCRFVLTGSGRRSSSPSHSSPARLRWTSNPN